MGFEDNAITGKDLDIYQGVAVNCTWGLSDTGTRRRNVSVFTINMAIYVCMFVFVNLTHI